MRSWVATVVLVSSLASSVHAAELIPPGSVILCPPEGQEYMVEPDEGEIKKGAKAIKLPATDPHYYLFTREEVQILTVMERDFETCRTQREACWKELQTATVVPPTTSRGRRALVIGGFGVSVGVAFGAGMYVAAKLGK